MKGKMSFKRWLKLVVFLPCLFLLGVGGGGDAAIGTEAEADRLAAEEAERERIAAGGEQNTDLEDRGDNFTPAAGAEQTDLDAEALAAIAGSADDEGKDKTPPKHVPYDRFAEKVSLAKSLEQNLEHERTERERLQARVAELEKGDKPAQAATAPTLTELETQLDGLQEKMDDLLIDGTPEERKELRTQINKLQRDITKAETVTEIETKTTRQTEQQQFQTVIDQAYTAFPFLDPKSPQANGELNDDINAYFAGLQAKGVGRSEALQKAVEKFAPAYAKEKGFTTETKDDPVARKKLQLEKEARERNADASLRQPAAIAHAGSGARSMESLAGDIASLDEKTFDSLPDAELRKQRGD